MEGHSWRGSATGLRLACVGIYGAALNRLVPVPLSCCAPTIRGGGGGAVWACAVQLGGLVHEAHNISWDHI